jgi:8-oxo-dGTP pyrophosphatase MutT (NUDIX family)
MASKITLEFITHHLQTTEHASYAETPFDQFAHQRRHASVLIPLAIMEGEWHILFTRRSEIVAHHKGQVSFPGGAKDLQDDSPESTALREAQEEIGLQPGDVQILGRLGDYLTVTNFQVVPVVGVIPWPYCFTVHTREVERVFTIPMAWLADPANFHEFIRAETGKSVIAYFPYDGELLWGATARMTLSLMRVLHLT